MKTYINKITGISFESGCECKGEDIELINEKEADEKSEPVKKPGKATTRTKK